MAGFLKIKSSYKLKKLRSWHLIPSVQFSSVQFSPSVMSNSLWPHGLQHARPPCPSPTPGVHQIFVSWWADEQMWYIYIVIVLLSSILQPNELQLTRLPCSSLSPWVCSNSCPLSQWYHSVISSSPVPFSSCPKSFPASRSFAVSWLFSSGGDSIGASPSASVLPINIRVDFL